MVDTSFMFADRLIELDGEVTHTHGPDGEHEHGTTAFTTWLDPEFAALHALSIHAYLAMQNADADEALQERHDALAAELRALDKRLAAAVAQDPGRPVLFSHPVYDYLERRYDVNGKSVHFEPDALPTDEQWAELDALLADHPAKWMIWEGEPLAEAVTALEERGIRSVVFAPCGNRPESGDLMDALNAGAAALEKAYGTD